MKRRTFLSLVGAAGASRVALGQRLELPVVGSLRSTPADDGTNFVGSLREGLQQSGYIDGKNVIIDFQWADNVYDRLPRMATEFVRRKVAVIIASGAVNAPLAAQAATETIPIVFIIGSDPVERGLVASLGRPGGNLTGVTLSAYLVLSKRLELLRELMPDTKDLGFLVNPNNPNAINETKEIRRGADLWNWSVHVIPTSAASDLEPAMATIAKLGAGGFLHSTDLFFTTRYPQLIELAARYKLAAIYSRREGPAAGGLLSYGPRVSDMYRLAGTYAGRILHGAKSADLPVEQASTFDLAVNLKCAKQLGITVPTSILLRATEVIE